MSKRTLYIHIGLHKTGTTAIQYLLYNNKAQLKKNGVCYPEAPAGVHAPRQQRFLIDLIHKKEKHKFVSYFRKPIREFPVTLISSECFLEETSFISWFGMLKTLFDDVKIIIYIRRQDQWIESTYSYFIKYHYKRLDLTIDDWVNGFLDQNTPFWYGLNWSDLVDKWSEAFGKENIIVRKYDLRHFTQGSLLNDFMDIIGKGQLESFKNKPEDRINRRISNRHELELLRITNPFMRQPEQEIIVSNLLPLLEIDNTPLTSPETKAKIMEWCRESNIKLANEYFDGDADIFSTDEIDHSADWQPYKGLPKDILNRLLEAMKGINSAKFRTYLKKIKYKSS